MSDQPTSQREATIRTAVVTYFPMFIATLSLLTSVYNGYLNNKFVEIIQRNLGRAEAMRTCKEIIDAYFQVKFRAGLVLPVCAQRERPCAVGLRRTGLGVGVHELGDAAGPARQRCRDGCQALGEVLSGLAPP